jgi:hypothetical protein
MDGNSRNCYVLRMCPKNKFVLNLWVALFFTFFSRAAAAQAPNYPWKDKFDPSNSLMTRISPPPGYVRYSVNSGSFADWLRRLPLKGLNSLVHLYDGQLKKNQYAHVAVVDIDLDRADLQQCADAVIRLRAEYLYSFGRFNEIEFNFTNGDSASFDKWILGYRPVIDGNSSRWAKSETVDSSYGSFREYLKAVFTYAGSQSLAKELLSVDVAAKIEIGDVWIRGGRPGTENPGHAIIVLDVARDTISNQPIFLLAQSYMPAQDIHLLKNPNDPQLSPWYRLPAGDTLHTPEWDFKVNELKRFR